VLARCRPHNPKGQPVRSEKSGGGGLSGVSGIDVHHEKGAASHDIGLKAEIQKL
jgi:hypothetical protein